MKIIRKNNKQDRVRRTYIVVHFVYSGPLYTGVSVIVLRRRRPELHRPYRVPFYPYLPLAYVVLCAVFVLNAFRERPQEAFIGLGIVLLGIPAYYLVRKRPSTEASGVETSTAAL